MARDPGPPRCSRCNGLTGLWDQRRIQRELGVSERAAEAIMRRLPKVVPPRDLLKKTYVRGEDLDEELKNWTVAA